MELCSTVHLSDGGKTVKCIKPIGHVGPHTGPHERVRISDLRPHAEPLARIQLADRLYFVCPESRRAYVQTILSGARYPAWVAERIAEGKVKRVFDVGCGEGAFAAFVWSVNPRVWVDAVEADESLRRLALLNAPPGTRILETANLLAEPGYGLIRVGDSDSGLITAPNFGIVSILEGATTGMPIVILDTVIAP